MRPSPTIYIYTIYKALSLKFTGDVSTPVGKSVPDENCHPLGVEVFRARAQTEKQL
jgi:hypothetical protein